MQKQCDDYILFRISGKIDPSYAPHFALESECDDIRHHCIHNNTAYVSVNLHMLFKWRERKGPEATYVALLEIFEKKNNEKMIDFILEYVANGHSQLSSEGRDLKFLKVNKRDDIPQLKKNYAEIKMKFTVVSLKMIKSLEKRLPPKHLAYYLSRIFSFRFESTDDITDIIMKTSSWFNTKVLEDIVNKFLSYKKQRELLHYKQELHAYLQQSIFNIPAESFQSGYVASDVKICYLKIPDDDDTLLDLSGNDAMQIEENLAEQLGIRHEVFNLCQYRLGCIELVFSVPTTVYESNCTLQQNVVPGQFQHELRLTVDFKDIL